MNTALRPEDWSVTVPPAAAASAALHGALLESRQRWQDLAGLGADLVFETDNAGRFTFLWPDTVLGHRASTLLGRRADSLLLGAGPNLFALRQAVRGHRAWMADADGQPRCLEIALAPLSDERGGHAGLRGAAHDVTQQEAAAASAAAGLRRAALLDSLAECVRHAGTAREALDFGLAGLRDALGCAGTAMLVPAETTAEIAAATSNPPPALIPSAGPALAIGQDWLGVLEGGEPAAVLHHHGRPPAASALAAWRDPGGRHWDPEDLAVLRSMAAMLGAVLGFDRMQRELERQASTDPLTGLANRRAFLDALEARLREGLEALVRAGPDGRERGVAGAPSHGDAGAPAHDGSGAPSRDGLYAPSHDCPDAPSRDIANPAPRDGPNPPSRDARGALVFLDLDNLKPLNDRHGHEAGDAALRATARLLRATAAPGDIAARFGGDEFILWINGADAATAISRARALLDGTALHDNDRAPRFSLGLAAWDPASGEGVDRLLARADAALYEAKRHGRGGWRLAGAKP
jgi:diguanylate cyclase (GGDEF)-like protein